MRIKVSYDNQKFSELDDNKNREKHYLNVFGNFFVEKFIVALNEVGEQELKFVQRCRTTAKRKI